MHLALVSTGMGKRVALGHGQGIHIGPQTNHAATGELALNKANYTGATDALVDLIHAHGPKLVGHHLGGPKLLELQLWVSVNITPHRFKFREPDVGHEVF
jgi:hypothetical protein